MNAAFAKRWLDDSTKKPDGLTPAQTREVRAMCERFYVAGIKSAKKEKQNEPTGI